MGSHDTLRHCQRARACRCGGEKSRALRQGRVFQLFVQMALWDTLGSGMDQHFAPELFAGTSKTTTFYMGFAVTAGHSKTLIKTLCFWTSRKLSPPPNGGPLGAPAERHSEHAIFGSYKLWIEV